MNKKRILIFIDWFLPGYRAGGPIQSCANLINHLKDEFAFSVVTRNADYMSTTPYATIKPDEWNILENGIRVFYFSSEKLSDVSIKKLLSTEKFDVLYLNGVFSFYFSLLPLYYAKKLKGKQVVVAVRGMLAVSALNIKPFKKQIFLAISKLIGLFKGITFHATNSEEEKDIKKIFGITSRVSIAPNLFQPDYCREWKSQTKDPGELRLVSIARIAPEKNTKYALEVLKKVKSKIVFDIYGPIYNTGYWEECKSLIKQMPSNITVNYKGSLESQKVLSTLSYYHYLFLPTTGENFGHIILQSLNASVPVIISDQTIWKNLVSISVGSDISLSNLDGFISAIESATTLNQPEYDRISMAAHTYSLSIINDKNLINQSRRLFVN